MRENKNVSNLPTDWTKDSQKAINQSITIHNRIVLDSPSMNRLDLAPRATGKHPGIGFIVAALLLARIARRIAETVFRTRRRRCCRVSLRTPMLGGPSSRIWKGIVVWSVDLCPRNGTRNVILKHRRRDGQRTVRTGRPKMCMSRTDEKTRVARKTRRWSRARPSETTTVGRMRVGRTNHLRTRQPTELFWTGRVRNCHLPGPPANQARWFVISPE